MKIIKKFIKNFKQKRKFRKDMIDWVKLCRYTKKRDLSGGIKKVGILTHEINIEGVGKISTTNPIFVKMGE